MLKIMIAGAPGEEMQETSRRSLIDSVRGFASPCETFWDGLLAAITQAVIEPPRTGDRPSAVAAEEPDGGFAVMLSDIETLDVPLHPLLAALIPAGSGTVVSARPVGFGSVRIVAVAAGQGRIRAIAATATLVRGCRHA